MDSNERDQIEQRLRQNWDSTWPQILDRFSTVSKSDLDSAGNTEDLIARISDKSDYSPVYVESELRELVGVGASTSQQRSQQGGNFTSNDSETKAQRKARRAQNNRQPFGHHHGTTVR